MDGYNEGGGCYEHDAVSGNSVSININDLGATFAPTSVYRIHGLDFTRDPTIRFNTVVLSHGRDYLFHIDAQDAGWLYLAIPQETAARIIVELPPG